MSTKVLVTGAKGQLGQTIQQLFGRKKGDIVFTYVSKNELNITNEIQIASFFKKYKFDYCINCAAYTNVEQAEKTPEIAFIVNAEGVKNLAKACLEANCVLIHISTDYVFDGKKNEPYSIHDVPNPINEYGASKLLGEQYIQKICQKYFIIRTSWLYSNYGHNFFKTIIKKIKEGEELKITTTQIGTPTSCTEFSKFIFFLIKTNQSNFGIYHSSALGEATWYDFAKEIAKHYNHTLIKSIAGNQENELKIKRPKYSVLSNHKTQLLIGIIRDWKNALNEALYAV